MNVKLLDKIAEHVVEDPRRVCMDFWTLTQADLQRFVKDHGENNPELRPYQKLDFPDSGRVCCIGALALFLSGQTVEFSDVGSGHEVMGCATALLEIDREQAKTLFYTQWWPAAFHSRLQSHAWQSYGYAEVVYDRIQAFKEQYAPKVVEVVQEEELVLV